MAHFAQLDQNSIVVKVIVINNDVINNLPFPESEPFGVEFCYTLYGNNTIWKQTSYNSNFRKNYAVVGGVYDITLDAFIRLKPYASWLLNTETCQWQAPSPRPQPWKKYIWDEETVSWVLLPE